MKTSRRYLHWFVLLFLTLFTLPLFAAEFDSEDLPSSNAQYWTLIISAVTPLIIGFIKWLVPKIPKWVLPTATPLVGVGLGLLMNWLTSLNLTWFDMAQAGALAVFVREVFNKTVSEHLATGSRMLLLMLFLLPAPLLMSGCATDRTLDPAGAYAGDRLLFEADGVIIQVNNVLTEVEGLAVRNPGPFASNEQLKNLLTKVKAERDGTPKPGEVLTGLIQLRDTYARTKSPSDATALQKSFIVARLFLDQARNLIATTPTN